MVFTVKHNLARLSSTNKKSGMKKISNTRKKDKFKIFLAERGKILISNVSFSTPHIAFWFDTTGKYTAKKQFISSFW